MSQSEAFAKPSGRTVKSILANVILAFIAPVADWWFRVWVAIDQLINVALFNGEPDETMSSAVYRMERDGRPAGVLRKWVDRIIFWQPHHCQAAYESEKLRLQLDPEFRT